MQITSNVLGDLGQAVPAADTGYETSLEVPPQVILTIPPRQISRVVGISINVQQTSFVLEDALVVSNAGASSHTFCIFGNGLWELDITGLYTSNYSTIGGAADLLIQINPSVLQSSLLRANMGPTTGGAVSFNRKVTINIGSGGFLVIALAANGAGQSHEWYVSMVACKLL